MITVQSAKAANLTAHQQKRLHEILTIAYALTEVEVWGENYVRIDYADYCELILKDEVLVALMDGEVVGGVHYYERANGLYCFSLLSADFDKSGLGIGRKLVNRVEEIAKANGATAIELEILRPRGIEVPFKVRIANWYKRQGYVYTHSQNFAEIKPIKAKKLANPSDFDYYRKELS